MQEFHVYKDIKKRTNGEIYLGIVGPVRTGKSTFIRKFMEHMVLPQMENGPKRQRTQDELPQAASGKIIMTTEPKFIPTEAASVKMEDGAEVKIRLIDCVGFMVDGAGGQIQEDKERLVRTPWFDHEIPFSKAAEVGTQKVIEEHSTIGIVITTDGTIGELARDAYRPAEEKTIAELKKLKKPFIVIVNSTDPYSETAQQAVRQIREAHKVSAISLNCEQLSRGDIASLMERILLEFPAREINYELPDWMKVLANSHPVKALAIKIAKEMLQEIQYMKDAETAKKKQLPEQMQGILMESMDLACGTITYRFQMKQEIYYQVVSEMAGFMIHTEKELMDALREYASIREQSVKLQSAMESVSQKGYGVVTPERKDIVLDEPQIMRHGNRYGVKMKATAPSIHMIKSMVETEIAPIVGSERQAADLITYIKQNAVNGAEGIWDTNIFGKSIEQIVDDGISAKINQMTDECQQKLQDAMEKIINDSKGGIICIII